MQFLIFRKRKLNKLGKCLSSFIGRCIIIHGRLMRKYFHIPQCPNSIYFLLITISFIYLCSITFQQNFAYTIIMAFYCCLMFINVEHYYTKCIKAVSSRKLTFTICRFHILVLAHHRRRFS